VRADSRHELARVARGTGEMSHTGVHSPHATGCRSHIQIPFAACSIPPRRG
jgi:hypothetical protein